MPLHEEPIHSLHVNSPSLSSLEGFPDKYAQRLHKAGFTTVSEIILINPDTLKNQTGLSPEEVEDIYELLSEICSPKVWTISERLKTEESGENGWFISLGTPDLDRLFGQSSDNKVQTVGIPTGLLTEIAGESACGKTCMSLQLSLNVQLPLALGGLNGGSIYLCTESAFPSPRLYEMAVGVCNRWKSTRSDPRNPSSSLGTETLEAIDRLNAEDLMDNVHLLRAQDPQTLIHTIHYSLPAFLGKQHKLEKPIKLIVLDSIGAIFRAEAEERAEGRRDGKYRMTARASEMNQVADGLKYLADRHRLAVVVVNQVSDVIDPGARALLDFAYPSSWRAGTGGGYTQASKSPRIKTPHPSSSPHPSSTPDSFSLTPATPVSYEAGEPAPVPPNYYLQARHFTGQHLTNNRKEAALGLAWTSAINIRIMLNKPNGSLAHAHTDPRPLPPLGLRPRPPITPGSLAVREAVVVFSPFGKTPLDPLDCPLRFAITSRGIVSLNDLSPAASS